MQVIEYIELRISHQMKTLFEQYREVIPEFPKFQDSLYKAIPKHIRVNRLKAEPEKIIPGLSERGVLLRPSVQSDDTFYFADMRGSPGNLLEYFLGYIHPQAFTSCLCATVLQPKKRSYILDMCASPGGKTSHLAQMMGDTGLIIANELYPSRHVPLGNTLDRLGVLNAVITGYQAQEFPLKQRFDYILADVPCSGEGTFRKTKNSNSFKYTVKMNNLPRLQKKIILRGFDLLKENGELLYATCTYNPEENESVVNFLLKNRHAKLLPIEIGVAYDPGIIEWQRNPYEKQIERCARFYPHRVDSVGFFMARIGRCQ
jgi:NOL1/NOP2/sun family putative RNA methylase